MNTIDLTGKVVVITGAAGGLGRAYARECARRGAALLLTDLDEAALDVAADEITRRGGIARAIVGDVADPAFTDGLADDCMGRWGSVDAWVNNAGVQMLQRIDEQDPFAVETMLRVNVIGTINGVRSAASAMRESGGGSIVNVTSGAQFGMRHLAVYGATKGAVASLTYAAAVDLEELGIRVNAVSPLARTRMTRDGDEHFSALTGEAVDSSAQLDSPDSVAGLVSYLVSDASSLTGQVLRLDGHELAVVRRPMIEEATVQRRDSWSAESIAEAVAGPLRGLLHRGTFESPARRQAETNADRSARMEE